MATIKSARKVMIVSGNEKTYTYFSGLLPKAQFAPIEHVVSAGEARRLLSVSQPDILIIDTPLADEFGVEFAGEAADMSIGVMLLVRNDIFDKVCYDVEDSGVLTLAKPNSRQVFYSAVKLLGAVSARLKKMENKNRTLQDKMEDIRAVNRAKWLLIDKMKMSEEDAHYFIEKRAMDARISRREVAESIIRTYDN